MIAFIHLLINNNNHLRLRLMNICETSSYITSYINDSVLIFVKEHVFFIRLGIALGPLMTSNILVHFLNEKHTHDDFKKAYYDVFILF